MKPLVTICLDGVFLRWTVAVDALSLFILQDPSVGLIYFTDDWSDFPPHLAPPRGKRYEICEVTETAAFYHERPEAPTPTYVGPICQRN